MEQPKYEATPLFKYTTTMCNSGGKEGGGCCAPETCVSAIAQKMKFSVKDLFSKYEQINSFLQICSHLLKKSLTDKCISGDKCNI